MEEFPFPGLGDGGSLGGGALLFLSLGIWLRGHLGEGFERSGHACLGLWRGVRVRGV